MPFNLFTAGLLAGILSSQPALAQATMLIPTGGGDVKPVPQDPPADPRDTPEEIAKDAARDLKDSRFYNKPGATRAQYDADWQECRLIARGSRTPAGTIPYYYNPAVISPLAAGLGAGIGGAIGAAIIEGQQRRANRRACLLIKGWRLVELGSDDSARIATMSEEERSQYFNRIVGADQVPGKITERESFSLVQDPALRLHAPVSGPASVFLGKKTDPAVPVKLGPGEAAIVITYRRPDEGSTGRSGALQLLRYDPAARDVIYRPRDWKKKGDKTTYSLLADSSDRKAPLEAQLIRVTPGDYVIGSTSIGTIPMTNTFCFGAPTFHVGEGEIAYVGDFIPYMNVKLSNGDRFSGLAYTSHIEDSRRALATKQPQLAALMKPALLRNQATFACAGVIMDRWDIAGLEALPEPEKKAPEAAESGVGGN